MNPLPRFLIKWTNRLLLQWLFARIFWMQEDDGEVVGFGMFFPVVPLTGYDGWEYVPREPCTWLCWKKGVRE